jgi:predicted DNA-binding protein
MKKQRTIAFRIDDKTLQYLQLLEEKSGNAKSVIIRNLIRQAAESTSLHKVQLLDKELL